MVVCCFVVCFADLCFLLVVYVYVIDLRTLLLCLVASVACLLLMCVSYVVNLRVGWMDLLILLYYVKYDALLLIDLV